MRQPRLFFAAALSLLCSAPLVALAQEDDPARRAAAQALFDQASALMDKHDYANACPKLEEVGRLQPGKVGTLITLGECYEGEGRVASAWTTYRQAADRATALNDARAVAVRRKADALAPRLPRLAVRVDAGTKGLAGLEIERDGLPIGPGAWDTPIPIDPGDHVVEAQAPDRAPLRATVKLREGESKDVTVALQPGPAGPAPLAVAPPPVATGGSTDTAQPAGAGSGRRTAGFVVGGAGVAGLAVGGILGIVTLVKVGSSNASTYCMGPTSNHPDVSECNTLRDAARGIQTGAIISAVAGGVLVGVGAVLVATAPRKAENQVGVTGWSLVLHPTGASFTGRF